MSAPGTIVTPEAVVLELETAGIGSRMVARAVDAAIQAILLLALVLGGAAAGAVIGRLGLAGVFIAYFVVVFVYPAAFETLWRGRTPGKAALGLRVVTVEGAPIRFRHAAIRALVGIIDVYQLFGAIGIVTMLINTRSQRLGDIVAGTVVLRERTGAKMPTAVLFGVPPGYESYVATLDVSGLTATDYGAVRAFLLRASSLEPTRRYELARQLATPLLVRLRQMPPSWVGPEALLACVAAAYQQRSRGAFVAPGAAVPARPPFPPPGESPTGAGGATGVAAPTGATETTGVPDTPGRPPDEPSGPPPSGYVPPS